jgi:hypothetical protein
MSTELLQAIKDLGLDLSNADDVRKLGAAVADILHDGTTSAFLYGMRDVEGQYGSHRVAMALKKAAQDASDAEFFDKMNQESEHE